jgi:hypothetical protein
MRKAVAVLTVLALLSLAAPALARTRLHGALKLAVVQGAYEQDGVNPPSNRQILNCMGGYRSTVRSNWADYYFTGGIITRGQYHNKPGCGSVASNGLAILKIEDGVWTPVTEFSGGEPCYVKSRPGQPKMPWGVVDDLFRIHCPTARFGSP